MHLVRPVDCGVTSAAVAFVVYGQLVSMKNRRRMLKSQRTGKMFSAKSDAAGKYLADFCAQVPARYRNLGIGSLTAPLRLIMSVWYVSRRSDLDIELVMDGLQAAGVIANDRFIVEIHAYGHVDAANPRVEIILEML